MRRFALALLTLAAVNAPAFAQIAQSSWTKLAPMPLPQCEGAAVVVDGKLWNMGGWTKDSNTPWAETQIYDAAKNEWSKGPALPEANNHHGVAHVGGKIYVIGGFSKAFRVREPLDAVWAFDLATQKWEKRAPMPAVRGAFVTAVVGDLIYAAGGERRRPEGKPIPQGANPVYEPVTDFAVYDTKADKWTTLPPLKFARDHAYGGAINGKIYVIGGRDRPKYDMTQVEEFDPATGQWRERAAMPTGRSGGIGAALGGQIFVFGGEGNTANPNGIYDNVESYDPAKDAWTKYAPMAQPRHSQVAGVIGDRIVMPGGAPKAGGDVVLADADAFQIK